MRNARDRLAWPRSPARFGVGVGIGIGIDPDSDPDADSDHGRPTYRAAQQAFLPCWPRPPDLFRTALPGAEPFAVLVAPQPAGMLLKRRTRNDLQDLNEQACRVYR